MKRDGNLQSLWQQENDFIEKKSDGYNYECDVLIVGGGITGLTTALLLQQSGKQCIIAEAQTIGFGTSSGTSAHLNNFFDTTYSKVAKDFGKQEAALLYAAATEALQLIQDNVERYNIDCGYSKATGYIFSVTEEQDKDLDEIISGGKEVGLPIAYTNENPFPIPYNKIASVQGQAQFNPAPYLVALANAFEAAGGKILQQCRVLETKGDSVLEVKTSRQIITAGSIVYATHIPPGVNLLHFRCAPYRSYVVAAVLADETYPADLGYDLNDPYHYYRSQEVNGKKYLIAGGEDHKTGHEENTSACFAKLESHLHSFFNIKEIAYHWSSQYFEPADGLAYIGSLPGNSNNIYVATGFGGNGLTYGNIAAILIRDLIVTNESPYKNLFDPKRLKPIAGFQNFIKEGADVVKTFIAGKFAAEKIRAVGELAIGEGKIVKYAGHSIAMYKDELHNIHACNPTCPHIGCTVAWNNAEKSWDCPCHGARYAVNGELLTGPSQSDLASINLFDTE